MCPDEDSSTKIKEKLQKNKRNKSERQSDKKKILQNSATLKAASKATKSKKTSEGKQVSTFNMHRIAMHL